MDRARILALALSIVGPAILPAQTPAPFSATRLARIDRVMQQYVDSGQIAGAVGLVLRNGRVVYQHAVGWSDLESRHPMTPTALFRIASQTKALTSVVILSLMVGVAAFNIVSTMVMVVKTKRRDIAIMRTFGSSPGSILSIFIVQGSLIGLLGIAAGMLLGVLISINMQGLVHGLEGILGIQFLDARVYFMSDLPGRVEVLDVVRIGAFAFVLACFSTVYPAVRAARLLPAESLRND